MDIIAFFEGLVNAVVDFLNAILDVVERLLAPVFQLLERISNLGM